MLGWFKEGRAMTVFNRSWALMKEDIPPEWNRGFDEYKGADYARRDYCASCDQFFGAPLDLKITEGDETLWFCSQYCLRHWLR